MTEHLSRHYLEHVIASEARSGPRPPSRAELQAQAHVLSCDVCTTRKRSIETARARFLALAPAAPFAHATLARAANAPHPASLDRSSRRRIGAFVVGGTALALAAAALLIAVRAPGPETIRLKGTVALQAFVKRGQRIEPIQDGDALRGGDQLGFVYTLNEPRHLLLLGIDEHGSITRYFPAQGAASAPLSPGVRRQLPIAIELDAQRGQERLFALFSDTPADEPVARRALTAALERARREGRGLRELTHVDLPVQQASLWYQKP